MQARWFIPAVVVALAFLAHGQQAWQPASAPAPQAASLPQGALARLGEVLYARGGQIEALAFSPDGSMILTAGRDSMNAPKMALRLWDARTGRELRKLSDCQSNALINVQFIGDRIIGLGDDGFVAIWDAATGRQIERLDIAAIRHFSCSADGRLLACGAADGKGIELWDLAEHKKVRTLPRGMTPRLSPDGSKLVSMEMQIRGGIGATHSMRLILWDAAKGTEIQTLTFENAMSHGFQAAFSPDNKRLAVAVMGDFRKPDQPTRIHTYDASSGQELSAGDGPRIFPTALAWSSDGSKIAAGGIAEMTLLDANSAKPIDGWPKMTMNPRMAFSPDGKTLAVATSPDGIALHDLSGKAERRCSPGLLNAAWSPSDDAVVTVDTNGGIARWQAADGKKVSEFSAATQPCRTVLSSDGRTAAVAGLDGPMRIFDVTKQSMVSRVAASQPAAWLAISDDGKRIASSPAGADGMLHIADVATGKEVAAKSLGIAQGGIISPLMSCGSSDIGTFAYAFMLVGVGNVNVGMLKTEARLLDVQSGATQVLAVLEQSGMLGRQSRWGSLQSLALSGGGDLVAISTQMSLAVQEVATGKDLAEFENPVPEAVGNDGVLWVTAAGGGQNYACSQLAFSSDGRLLAGDVQNVGVFVWDLASSKLLTRFAGTRGRLTTMAFSHNGQRLVTGSEDGTAIVWAVPKPAALPVAAADGWQRLADGEAAKAYVASCELVADGEKTVTMLVESLKPAAATPADVLMRVRELVAALDSDDFDTRDKANKDLESLGEQAEAALKDAAKAATSDEVKGRIEELLANLTKGTVTSGQVVRSLRAVSVLERIGTPAAKQLLDKLATGDPTSRLTLAARSASARLATRQGAK